jgi:hypothetical protein
MRVDPDNPVGHRDRVLELIGLGVAEVGRG